MAIIITYNNTTLGTLTPEKIGTLNIQDTIARSNISITDNTSIYTGDYTTTLISLGIAKPVSLVTTTYNGNIQNNGYTTPNNVTQTGSTSGTNAGDYVAIYTPNDGYCWNDGTRDAVSITLRINPKSISGATITLGTNLTYNIIPLTLTVTAVTIDNFSATYTVSGNTATNAGTYTLTCTGTGNFTGTQTASYTIARATINTFTLSNGTAKTYNGSALSVTVGIVHCGTMNATYSTSGTYSATTVGTYTATVTGTGNFQGSLSVTWIIQYVWNKYYIAYSDNTDYRSSMWGYKIWWFLLPGAYVDESNTAPSFNSSTGKYTFSSIDSHWAYNDVCTTQTDGTQYYEYSSSSTYKNYIGYPHYTSEYQYTMDEYVYNTASYRWWEYNSGGWGGLWASDYRHYATETLGSYISQATSTSSSTYPENGTSGGYWYVKAW